MEEEEEEAKDYKAADESSNEDEGKVGLKRY